MIKGIDKDFLIKIDNKEICLLIHETRIELIKRKEMKNNEVLNFIKIDDYFNKPEFDKAIYRPIEVLDGIDIETLDEAFFKNWIKINFNMIFNKCIYQFYEKIASLIKDMKYFGLLYKFFLIYKEKDYKSEILQIMKNKFMELLPKSNIERCQNFVEETIKLISLLDKKNLETKNLLELIQNNLDFEKVYNLYIKLSDKNKELNKNTKEIIDGYFTSNKNNKNPLSLIYLIKNCKNIRKDVFSKINKYAVNELDFLFPYETENYKLFKGLIDNNVIDREFEYKCAKYIEIVMKNISVL